MAQDFPHFLFGPDVVSRGDRVGPDLDDIFEGVGLDTGPVRQVFTVGHRKVDLKIRFHPADAVVDRVPARFSNNVADEEDVHGCPFSVGDKKSKAFIPPRRPQTKDLKNLMAKLGWVKF
jgi:hypothetical protein